MVNIDILEEEYGLTQEFFRDVLGGDMATKMPKAGEKDDNYERRIAMRNRIRSRIDEGMTRNFATYHVYYALDQAWDAPFRQISQTLVQTLIDKDPSSDEVLSAVSGWGLTSMLSEERDPKTNKPTGKKTLNLPVFINVFVPLAISVVTSRWAAIVNDARQSPFFKFEPAKLRMDFRVKSEAVTDRVDTMDKQFGYFNTYKQATFKMLHYGSVYQFPQEEWYTEEQMREATQQDVDAGEVNEDGKTVKVGEIFKKITKEGLRYHHPHPARTYRDLAHPACGFLTDSGPEFAGYWKIVRYRDVAQNSSYYSNDQIGLSNSDIVSKNLVFFQTVYGAGVMTYPVMGTGQGEQGVGELDREKKIANLYYGTDHLDQGILLTEHFEKINPKRDGLVNPKSKQGTKGYDCPVWFRFLIAGTNGTIVYAAPLPCCAVQYAGYDSDESRAQCQSLTMQVQPYSDVVSNLVIQMLLSMRQNLANMVLIDTDQIADGDLTLLKNVGEKFFRVLNFIGFSSAKAKKAQHQVPLAAQSFSFPKANLQEQMQAIQTTISIMERFLGVSSQEVGQAASHEQTREEIINLSQTQSNRLTFTKTPLEQLRDAQKVQIYSHLMTYGSDSFWAEIPCDREITPTQLTAWGFETENLTVKHGSDRHIRVKFDRKKTAIEEHAFASTRDGDDRYNDPQIAMAMTAFVKGLMDNPMTAQAIGPVQAIALANVIAQYAGLPRDFKLRSLIKDGEQPSPDMAKQILAAVMQQVQPALQQMGGQIQQIGQGVQAVGGIEKELQQLAQALTPISQQSQKNAAAITQIFKTLQAILPPTPDANGNPNQPTPAQPV
jgi:methyl-accepting chemotaxis protein